MTPELSGLRRAVGDLRNAVASAGSRYGDIPAVRRLIGDVERLELDRAELDDVVASGEPIAPSSGADVHVLDDTPLDPSLWADADDEGVGGYHGGAGR